MGEEPQFPRATLTDSGVTSRDFIGRGIVNFADAARHVWRLPYGRNSDRSDWRLVLREGRGTCSTKHALLAVLTREQGLDIDLILAIYENEANTPGTGPVLAMHGLACIPEAHCFLRWQGRNIDLTMPAGRPANESMRFLHEEAIVPERIADRKVKLHRATLVTWLASLDRDDLDIERLWIIREACIAAISVTERPEIGSGS